MTPLLFLCAVVCPLVVGIVLGAAGVYYLFVQYVRSNPLALGTFFSATLRAAASSCSRSCFHIRTESGGYERLEIEQLCEALDRELPTWVDQQQRGLSRGRP